jgi:plasmid maintenance system antidote protein VapI
MKCPDPISRRNHFFSLNFCDLQGRLITFVVTRIKNGEFTERRLARVLGVSQPQLHNVLKGARTLKPDFADCLLRQFNIGVLDLFGQVELAMHLRSRDGVPDTTWLEAKGHGIPENRKSPGKANRSDSRRDRLAS